MRTIFWVSVVSVLFSLIGLGAVDNGAAMAGPGFSLKSFKGSYALGFIGTDLALGQIAGTGVLTADGKGNLTGTETIKDDTVVCTENLSGSYTVNPDGTGTGAVTVESTPDIGNAICTGSVGHEITFSLVLFGHGSNSKVKFSETSPNYIILGQGDRQ
jgi:hypothetical protein